MTTALILAALSLSVAQLLLSKRWAFIPLLVAGAHLGNREILPELTTARLLILIGLGNALRSGYLTSLGKSPLDRWFLLFSFVAILSAIGHRADPWAPSPFSARVGLALNVFGTYLYGRAYLPDLESFKRFAMGLIIVILPLAVGMLIEQRTRKNLYHVVGAGNEIPILREDRVRAQGPFRHPILAGTAGATILPFAYLALRTGNRVRALIGLASCTGVVLACASSGPLAALSVGAFGIGIWRWRHRIRWILWSAIAFAIFFVIFSGRGPWYLMASMDLVGGSTGWHRAKLIDQGYVYISEWWLWGTDYTRHWMVTGVSWSPNHVDMTNYYLHLGVIGGLPLTLTLVCILVSAFRMLGRRMRELRAASSQDEIILWCAGTSLAMHAISFASVSYYDQMYVFFYILLGAIPGLVATAGSLPPTTPTSTPTMTEPVAVSPLRYYS